MSVDWKGGDAYIYRLERRLSIDSRWMTPDGRLSTMLDGWLRTKAVGTWPEPKSIRLQYGCPPTHLNAHDELLDSTPTLENSVCLVLRPHIIKALISIRDEQRLEIPFEDFPSPMPLYRPKQE